MGGETEVQMEAEARREALRGAKAESRATGLPWDRHEEIVDNSEIQNKWKTFDVDVEEDN